MKIVLSQEIPGGSNPDGRVEGHGTHSSPTNTSKIHLRMESLSENTYLTLAEALKHWKGQEKSPGNQVGKREKIKRNWDGTCTPGRELKKKKGSCTLGIPSQAGKPARAERDIQRLREEGTCTVVAGRMETCTCGHVTTLSTPA